jgi:hypothetical protein
MEDNIKNVSSISGMARHELGLNWLRIGQVVRAFE